MNFVGDLSTKKWSVIALATTLAIIGLVRCCFASDSDPLPYVEIVTNSDLQSDGKLSQDSQKPILILFSMEGCAYCRYVEEEHLKPMLRNSTYNQKVIIRRVMTNNLDEVIDFDGHRISTMELSERYHAMVTPTVVFVDHKGVELSPRLLGVSNTEFYGGDIDEGLEISLRKIRKQLALQ